MTAPKLNEFHAVTGHGGGVNCSAHSVFAVVVILGKPFAGISPKGSPHGLAELREICHPWEFLRRDVHLRKGGKAIGEQSQYATEYGWQILVYAFFKILLSTALLDGWQANTDRAVEQILA